MYQNFIKFITKFFAILFFKKYIIDNVVKQIGNI